MDSISDRSDTLEDNVRYLLSRCPFTVRDHSGDRTGTRAREDLAGSLAITFLGMEQRIRELESTPAAPSTRAPADADLDNIEDMLAGYATVVSGCRLDEIERFDYLPSIEGALEDFRRLRAAIAAESGRATIKAESAASGVDLPDGAQR